MRTLTKTTPRQRYRRYCEDPPRWSCPTCLSLVYSHDLQCPDCGELMPPSGWPEKEELGVAELGTLYNDQYLITRIIEQAPQTALYRVISNRLIKDFAMRTLGAPPREDMSFEQLMDALVFHSMQLSGQETPHLVKIQDITLSPPPQQELHIVLDLLCGQQLEPFLRTKSLSLGQIKALMSQLILGLQNLHRKGLTHGDLTSATILVDELLPRHYYINITDPGLNHLIYSRADLVARRPQGAHSPEHQDLERPLTKASDIYCLGILFTQLLCAGKIVSLGQPLRDALKQHQPSASPDLRVQLCSWIEQLRAHDPTKRPTLEQLQHRLGQLPWRNNALAVMDAPPVKHNTSPRSASLPLRLIIALKDDQAAAALQERVNALAPSMRCITADASALKSASQEPSLYANLLILDASLTGSYDLTLFMQLQAQQQWPTIIALPRAEPQLELQLFKIGAIKTISLEDAAAINAAKIYTVIRRLSP